MAGHSKFKNIMFRKGAQDKKRSKLFSKLSREITVAAKSGMPEPSGNARLRNAIIAARAQNMPRERIERAIQKSAEAGGSDWQEMRYEGFAAGGVAVIVEALTDNRNRTASELRAIFSKFGGGLGETGSAEHMFRRCGVIHYLAPTASADAAFEAAAEAGADDCTSDAEVHEIVCGVEDFTTVRAAMDAKFGEPVMAQLQYRPVVETPVQLDTLRTVVNMLEIMEDNDDVQHVWSNFDASADDLAAISEE